MPTVAAPIAPSIWLVMAGIGSMIVGIAHVALHVRLAAGGGARGTWRAIRDRKGQLAAIIIVDFVGGVLVGAAAWATGITEPVRLISLVERVPWLGWLIVGGLGPLVAARLFGGSVVRDRFTGWLGPSGGPSSGQGSAEEIAHDGVVHPVVGLNAQAWRLRREALLAIEMRAWVLVQRSLTAESQRLLKGARFLIVEDLGRAKELAMITRRMAETRHDAVPPAVRAAAERISGELSLDVLRELLDALVNELIDSQTWEPLEILLGDANDVMRIDLVERDSKVGICGVCGASPTDAKATAE